MAVKVRNRKRFFSGNILYTLSMVVFHRRSSSVKGCLPSKVVFHQMSSSIKGRLPSKVIFHRRSSSIRGRLPFEVVFHQWSSSIKGCLSSKAIFLFQVVFIIEVVFIIMSIPWQFRFLLCGAVTLIFASLISGCEYPICCLSWYNPECGTTQNNRKHLVG